MDRVRNLLEQIRNRLEELNKAEKKVAEVILLNPQQATRFSIAALAQAASVSEPTVNRFCRSFGVSGYPELKLQLAQSLASGAAYVSRAVEADDNPEAYTQKIFGSAIASLDAACQALDPALISKAVDLLIQARQIHFFGLGASAPVAMDALHKFFRFNLSVTAHADVLMQRMIASVAHTGELFVIMSYTGRTRELGEVARIARENGASVLGVTAENSPLAKVSTVSMNIPLPEDTDIYMPMTSRIIQLTVLDVLATGMTLRRGVDFQPHLRKIKESLNDSRYPVGDEFNEGCTVLLWRAGLPHQAPARACKLRCARSPGARLAPAIADSTHTNPDASLKLTPSNGRLPGCHTTVSALSPVSMHSSRCQAWSLRCNSPSCWNTRWQPPSTRNSPSCWQTWRLSWS